MMTHHEFRNLALSFPESEEQSHFEKTSFRVKKKIFATMHESKMEVVLKLNEVDQSVFSGSGPSVYPVPNKWGKQGWTIILLEQTHPDLVQDALSCSYKEVAPKKLSDLI